MISFYKSMLAVNIRWKILRHFSEFDQNFKITIKIFHTLSDLLTFSNGCISVWIVFQVCVSFFTVTGSQITEICTRGSYSCTNCSFISLFFIFFFFPISNFSVLFSCFLFLCLRQFSATENTGEKLRTIELYLSFTSNPRLYQSQWYLSQNRKLWWWDSS